MKISICIPTYEAHGEAVRLLERAFASFLQQRFTDFEVVISDNSDNDAIEQFCKDPRFASLRINYFKNLTKGMAPNSNSAMRGSQGELIKVLYMDDYLAHENALQEIADAFEKYPEKMWLATGCAHDIGDGKPVNPHFPTFETREPIQKRVKKAVRSLLVALKLKPEDREPNKNTIGSPSVVSIRRTIVFGNEPIVFDENMTWLLDWDWYQRIYSRFGKPVFLNTINMIIGVGKHQTTHHLDDSIKYGEQVYMGKKYDKLGTIINRK